MTNAPRKEEELPPVEPMEIACRGTSLDELRQLWQGLSLFSWRSCWRILLVAILIIVATALWTQDWPLPAMELLVLAAILRLAARKWRETAFLGAVLRSGILGATRLGFSEDGLRLEHADGSTTLYSRRAFDGFQEHEQGLLLFLGSCPRLFLPCAATGLGAKELRQRLGAILLPPEPAPRSQENMLRQRAAAEAKKIKGPAQGELVETEQGRLVYAGLLPHQANERSLHPLSPGGLWLLLGLSALNALLWALGMLFLRAPESVSQAFFWLALLVAAFLPSVLRPGLPDAKPQTVRCRYGEDGFTASFSDGRELCVPYAAPLRLFRSKGCSFLLLPSQEQVPFSSLPPQLASVPSTPIRHGKWLAESLCLISGLFFCILTVVIPLLLVFLFHFLGLELPLLYP